LERVFLSHKCSKLKVKQKKAGCQWSIWAKSSQDSISQKKAGCGGMHLSSHPSFAGNINRRIVGPGWLRMMQDYISKITRAKGLANWLQW
jgi:hypothetical protein